MPASEQPKRGRPVHEAVIVRDEPFDWDQIDRDHAEHRSRELATQRAKPMPQRNRKKAKSDLVTPAETPISRFRRAA